MKKLFLILFFVSNALCSYADSDEIVLTPGNNGKDRSNPPSVFDMPCANYDDLSNMVTIDGAGYVSYYDVEISSASTGYVEISTVVNGTYDTIDVSSLPTGTHVITIESPIGNIYEGTFST